MPQRLRASVVWLSSFIPGQLSGYIAKHHIDDVEERQLCLLGHNQPFIELAFQADQQHTKWIA